MPCDCERAQEAARAGRGVGHLWIKCLQCEDAGAQTYYYEPEHMPGRASMREPPV